jgi:hypothetical protein
MGKVYIPEILDLEITCCHGFKHEDDHQEWQLIRCNHCQAEVWVNRHQLRVAQALQELGNQIYIMANTLYSHPQKPLINRYV